MLLEHWSSLVRRFKDEEDPEVRYQAEQLTDFVLDYVRYTRFRQYNLFTQKRGEEFETLVTRLEQAGFSVEMFRRFLEDDERWNTLLEVAGE